MLDEMTDDEFDTFLSEFAEPEDDVPLDNCERCGTDIHDIDLACEGLCRDCLMDLLMIDDERLNDYLDDKYHDRHNQRLL